MTPEEKARKEIDRQLEQCGWNIQEHFKDQSLEDSDGLPEPDVVAQEIADDLQTVLDQFSSIVEGLKE